MSRGERLYRRLMAIVMPHVAEDEREELAGIFRDMRDRSRRGTGLSRISFWPRVVADLLVSGWAELAAGSPGRPGERWVQDTRHALRRLIRAPGATLTAVLTLSLGVGGTTAMFSVVDGVVLKPLPYPEPDRLVAVWERTDGGEEASTSFLNFQDWRAGTRSVEAMAAYTASRPATVLTANGGVWGRVASVSSDFFDVVGTEPLLGRSFGPDENRPGGPPLAVVSHDFWRDALGAPPALNGVAVNLEGVSHDVIGVMPAILDVPSATDVWLPLERAVPWTTRGNHVVRVLGRLRADATLATARDDLNAVQARTRARHGEGEAAGVSVRALHDQIVGDTTRPLAVLLAAAAVLMLVACTNVASTLLARGLARRREMAVRASLGAGRGRLVRQLVSESVVLGLLGGCAGLVVAQGLLFLARSVDATAVPRLSNVGLDGRVLLFTAAAALFTALLFGLVPSFQLTKGDLAGSLRGARAGSAERGVRASWRVLMAAEVALALVLLVGAGLTGRSLMAILERDNGIRVEGVVTGRIDLPGAKYRTAEAGVAFVDELLETLGASPAVDEAGIALLLPVQGQGSLASPVELGDGRRSEGVFQYRVADVGFFRALGVPLLRGRLFEDADRETGPHVAVVDEVMARRLWPGADPIGRRFNPRGMDPYPDEWLTVVGVVAEVRNWSQAPGTNPTFYVSHRQRPAFLSFFGASVVVRGPGEATLATLLRERIRALDADVPVRVSTLRSQISDSARDRRFIGSVMGAFAALALLLAVLGVYGVVSYIVAQRTREIGIRLALGAAPSRVRSRVLRDALGVAGVGVGVGLLAAGALSHASTGLLLEVSPLDPWTFAGVAAALMGAATVASWIPARRSARVDPALTLTAE